MKLSDIRRKPIIIIAIAIIVSTAVLFIHKNVSDKKDLDYLIQNQTKDRLVASAGSVEPFWYVNIFENDTRTHLLGKVNLNIEGPRYFGTFTKATHKKDSQDIIFVGTLIADSTNKYNVNSSDSFAVFQVTFKKQRCRDNGDQFFDWTVVLSAKDESKTQFFRFGEVGCGEVYMDE